jgi:hypothetical protein
MPAFYVHNKTKRKCIACFKVQREACIILDLEHISELLNKFKMSYYGDIQFGTMLNLKRSLHLKSSCSADHV